MRVFCALFLILLSACELNPPQQLTTPARPSEKRVTPQSGGDRGFRWTDVGCMKEGSLGLNPGFVGECGSLPDENLTTRVSAGIVLKGANLLRALLTNVDLSAADMSHVTAAQAKLRGANLIRADLSYSNFVGAELIDAHFNFATLRKTDLRGARLDNAQLQSSVMIGTLLDGASLVGADLTGVDLRETSLQGAIYNSETKMSLTSEQARARGMVFWGR
jgi:uncharacterized protein YjbI with pentapeptide repeats